MLSPRLSQWFLSAQEECNRLAGELADCLKRERRALIEWRIEEVLQTTSLKEDLANQIKGLRNQMREQMSARAGLESMKDLKEAMDPEIAGRWMEVEKRWETAWNEVRNLCETNQLFMEHSQKTMGIILSEWKRLVGEQPRYGAKGEKVERSNTGKVVQKSF